MDLYRGASVGGRYKVAFYGFYVFLEKIAQFALLVALTFLALAGQGFVGELVYWGMAILSGVGFFFGAHVHQIDTRRFLFVPWLYGVFWVVQTALG